MKNSVWIIIGVLLLWACNSTPEFTRTIDGKDKVGPTSDGLFYGETILVKHTPKDTLERMKMMINYHDTTGLSLADLKKRGDITFYYMGFVKNTCATRKFHLEKQMHVKCNSNETYTGDICIVRMEESPDKWKIVISYNLGTEPDADYIGTKSKGYILYDERDSNFYENHKKYEIVRYYRELQGRKRYTKKSK